MATVEGLQAKLKEAVKTYEAKLAALNAVNSALQKENEQLREDLEDAMQPKTDAELDAAELKEEFARRLGEHQRTIDQLKDDKSRLSRNLREMETAHDMLREQMSSLEEQLIQARQQAANYSLNSAAEVEMLREQLAAVQDDAELQIAQAREAALQQIADTAAEAADEAAAAAAEAAEREAVVAAALEEARAAVLAAQAEADRERERFGAQIARLQERARQLEHENKDLVASSSETTQPLIRQLEAATAAAAQTAALAAEREWSLQMRLEAAEDALAAAQADERSASARAAAAEAALTAAKETAAAAVQEAAALKSKLESATRHGRALEAERKAAEERLAAAQEREAATQGQIELVEQQAKEKVWEAEQKLRLLSQEHGELRKEVEKLRGQIEGLEVEREQMEEEHEKELAEAEARAASAGAEGETGPVPGAEKTAADTGDEAATETSASGSLPALKLGNGRRRPSVFGMVDPNGVASTSAEGDTDSPWRSRRSSSSGTFLIGAATGVTGETGQQVSRMLAKLQAEANAAIREKEQTSEQLYQALRRASEAEAAAAEGRTWKEQAEQVQNKLDVAVEVIGERSMRIEELEADLVDMREIFKVQMQEAMAQVADLKEKLEAAGIAKSLQQQAQHELNAK